MYYSNINYTKIRYFYYIYNNLYYIKEIYKNIQRFILLFISNYKKILYKILNLIQSFINIKL